MQKHPDVQKLRGVPVLLGLTAMSSPYYFTLATGIIDIIQLENPNNLLTLTALECSIDKVSAAAHICLNFLSRLQ